MPPSKKPLLASEASRILLRQKLNVVLLEDDEEDAYLMRAAFARSERFEVHVLHVKTSDAAIEICENIPVDLVIADYWLGAEDSLGFLRHTGGRCAAVPALLITGQKSPDIELRGFDAGAFSYLSKDDVSPQNLDAIILATLQAHKVEREMIGVIERQERAMRTLSRLLKEEQGDAGDKVVDLSRHSERSSQRQPIETNFQRGDLIKCLDQALCEDYALELARDKQIIFNRPNLPLMIEADMAFLTETFTEVVCHLLDRMKKSDCLEIAASLAGGMCTVSFSTPAIARGSVQKPNESEQLFFASYIVKLHQGSLWIDDTESSLAISLPLRVEA